MAEDRNEQPAQIEVIGIVDIQESPYQKSKSSEGDLFVDSAISRYSHPVEKIRASSEGDLFVDSAISRYSQPAEKIRASREQVRSITAFIFIGIFALTVVASLAVVMWFGKEDYPNLKDLLQPLLPAETGLIGSVVGFYFGAELVKQRERD